MTYIKAQKIALENCKTEDFEGFKGKYIKTIEKNDDSDIIKTENTKEDIRLQIVGKIDREIYKCITEDIRTDEVIITDERIGHIIERHGRNFYDTYREEFAGIIRNPDYIFLDKENTALVCKEFVNEGKYVNVVLRIAVSTDNSEYKNSILTAVGGKQQKISTAFAQ